MNLERNLIFYLPDGFIFGGFENVDVDKNGDAIKTYSDLINNKLKIGIQPNGVGHIPYKKLGIIDFGNLYPPFK